MSALPQPNAPRTADSVFIVVNGKNFGPYTPQQVQAFLQSGQVTPDTPCWVQGATAPVPVRSLPVPPPAGVVAGAPMYAAPVNMAPGGQPLSRMTYILLGLFLGGLGIHNFYAGYKGKAIAQLLITVLSLGMLGFVTGIWALIEVCTVTQDARGVPLAR